MSLRTRTRTRTHARRIRPTRVHLAPVAALAAILALHGPPSSADTATEPTAADDAPSARERLARAEAELALEREAAALEHDCGFVPRTSIDWPSFPADTSNYSVPGYCETLVDALGAHCRSGPAKRAHIAERVETLSCAYGTADAPGVDIDGGRVTGRFRFEMPNLEEAFGRELLERL